MSLPRPRGSACVLLPVVLAVAMAGPSLAAAQVGRPAVALWTPEYSSPLYLNPRDDAMSLTLDAAGGLWLAGEDAVTRFADGQWEAVQAPPGSQSLFALAPSGQDTWGFGYEGAVWQRLAGRWAQRAAVTAADLYDATLRGSGEAWAAGFDYVSEQGTLVRATAEGIEAYTWPALYRQQLYSLAAAPDGSLWAGGCSYEDLPLLLRGDGDGRWHAINVPLTGGCVFDLSFAPGGHGLAAAGSDLLLWDGANWMPMGQAPPAGLQWLRVAAVDQAGGLPEGNHEMAGWAIPAQPNWRGYRSGAIPWYFDGEDWEEAVVDYGPWTELFAPDTARPFVGLAGQDGIAWTVSLGADGLVALLRLEGGAGRLWHPGLDAPRDLAALPDGTLWVAGGGATPLLGRVGGRWRAGVLATDIERPEFHLVDVATPRAGWALATEGPGGSALRPWRWNGMRWSAVDLPEGWNLRRIRALPDGGAWAVDDEGRLLAWQAGVWSAVPGAPRIELATASDVAPNVRLPTPFDVAGESDRWVACLATGDGLYRYEDGVFERLPSPQGARFMDLQLVDSQAGWALPTELAVEQLGTQVARLNDCQAELLRLAWLPGWPLGPFQAMAASRADSVWLYRGADRPGAFTQLVAYHSGQALPFVTGERCDVRGLAALPESAPLGSDLWLAGGPWSGLASDACGPVAPPVIPAHSGLVSRLRLHSVASALALPALLHGAPIGNPR